MLHLFKDLGRKKLGTFDVGLTLEFELRRTGESSSSAKLNPGGSEK